MPDRMSGDMSERMADRMSEDMSERMSEEMSERMPEDVRQNVRRYARKNVRRYVSLNEGLFHGPGCHPFMGSAHVSDERERQRTNGKCVETVPIVQSNN